MWLFRNLLIIIGKISGSGGMSACTVLCALALAGSIALPLNTVHAVIPEGTGSGMSLGNGTETGSDPNNVAIGGYAKSLGTVAFGDRCSIAILQLNIRLLLVEAQMLRLKMLLLLVA